MSEVREWDVTAANNNDAPPDGFPEGMDFSEVNNAAREVMAAVARYRQALGAVSTTGSNGAYTLMLNLSISSFVAGDRFIFTANHNSVAGGATLTVNSTGPVAIVSIANVAIGADDIVAGQIIEVVHDGTSFRIISGFGVPAGGIGTAQIADDAVTNAKIADDAVDSAQIADEAVGFDQIEEESITNSRIGVGQIFGSRIADETLSLEKLTQSVQDMIGLIGGGIVEVVFRTSSGTVVTPSDANAALYFLVGAGGGYGGYDTTNGFGGGGGEGGAIVIGFDDSVSGNQTLLVGNAGSNGSDGSGGSSGSDGSGTTFLGSTANGGDGGSPGSNNAGGSGGSGDATVTLNGSHSGGGIDGRNGLDGNQFDSVSGVATNLEEALATGKGGDSPMFGAGRGGGGEAGNRINATNGAALIIFVT